MLEPDEEPEPDEPLEELPPDELLELSPPDAPVVAPAAAPFLQSLDGLVVLRQSLDASFFELFDGFVLPLVEDVVSFDE